MSGPKGAIPAGHHWYYRIEQPSKRQCWYSRAATDKAETGKTARAAPPEPTPAPQAAAPSAAADPVSPPNLLARKSIADARAELTAPQIRVEGTSPNVEPRTGAAPAEATASPSYVASRWPDYSDASSAASGPRLASAEPARSSPASQPATVALAAADSSLEKQSTSMQMLLLTLAGALALAGITASLIFRFGRARTTPRDIRNDRRAIWDQVDAERSSPSIFPNEDIPVWRGKATRTLPRDPRAPDDPERRVTEMLSRLARSAQT